MCYAIPGKIAKIDGEDAVIDYEGVTKTAKIALIENPKIGDFVLVHAGFAIEKLDKRSAEESLKLIKEQIERTEGKK